MRKEQIALLSLGLILIFALSACHRPKPTTAPAAAPMPAPPEAPKPAPPAPPPATPPQTQPPPPEDPLLSGDLAVVNQELVRRGFQPDVYFPFNVSLLDEKDRNDLLKDAEVLKGAPNLDLTLEGHCDERGTSEYNLALGERRAFAVKSYLESLGVPAGRLQPISYGLERPVCTEHEESCWSRNRRVHLVVTGRAGHS